MPYKVNWREGASLLFSNYVCWPTPLASVTSHSNEREPRAASANSVCDTCRLQTCTLVDLQTCRPADLQTCRPADLQTVDLQTCRPAHADLQTCRPGDRTRSFADLLGLISSRLYKTAIKSNIIYIDLARPKSGAPHLFFMLVGP